MLKKQLVDEMMAILTKYNHHPNRDAVEKIFDEWLRKKWDLLEHLRKHPNWDERTLSVRITKGIFRPMDTTAISHFSYWISDHLYDVVYIKKLLPKPVQDRLNGCTYLPNDLYNLLMYGLTREGLCISDRFYDICQRDCPEAHVGKGQKTTKAVNKLLKYLGFSAIEDYNREYAKFADALSPKEVKEPLRLSIHPMDYLTMSFGNSWASCHTIDKDNIRHMPNSYQGMYASGTMSYMLDGTSMVLYSETENPWEKKTRQMFHYSKGNLIQARLYPNEDDQNRIQCYRELVEDIISKVYGLPNFWDKKLMCNTDKPIVTSLGTHYRDYHHFSSRCNFALNKECEPSEIIIGHAPICVECGEPHSTTEWLNHCAPDDGYFCTDCGRYVSEDDVIFVGGEPYCDECVSYCDICGEYHLNEFMTEVDDTWVCDNCYDDYTYTCEACGNVHLVSERQNAWHPVGGPFETYDGHIICGDCIDEFVECDSCGLWVPKDKAYPVDGEAHCPNCYEEESEVA